MTNFESLYLTEHKKMWRSIVAFSGSSEVASDSVSEAFTQLINRGPEVRDAKAWVWRSAYRIASGLLADAQRTASGVPVPDQVATSTYIWEVIDQLKTLSDQQRIIVVLRYVAELKPVEIADVIDTTPATIRVQLHRAHSILRQNITFANQTNTKEKR